MSNSTFQQVPASKPGRSVFDLSYSKLFTADMGLLYPVVCDEMVPGDKFNIGNEIVVRMQPLVAPVLHEINCYVHYFFYPYRLLWEDWEKFITGGEKGTDTSVLPRFPVDGVHVWNAKGTIWDMMGWPINILPEDAMPLDFPRRAYVKCWNEFYRDEWLQDELPVDTIGANGEGYWLLRRNWEKDYFSASLLSQQKGTAPSLPLSGLAPVEFGSAYPTTSSVGGVLTGVTSPPGDYPLNLQNGGVDFQTWLTANGLAADVSGVTTFDVADLRLVFQVQKWMERNARGGSRYTEFLHSHFGVSPSDSRLQRGEYIGGSKAPVIVSEVLQTSESGTTPQGNMAGHGISVNQQFCGSYYAEEYGVVIGLLSIMPKPMYQQGINRQWLRRSKYDFYFPEFANLSEQAVEEAEIYAVTAALPSTPNTAIFGYQGRYDEMRYKPNMVCGDMRDTFDYWHMSRQFAAAPDLNSQFIECDPRKDCFAVPSEPGFIVSCGNLIKAIRPLPVLGQPGLIDHH